MSFQKQIRLTVESTGTHGFHVIAAKLGDVEIHRDLICIEQAMARQHFISTIRTKLGTNQSTNVASMDNIDKQFLELISSLKSVTEWEKPISLERCQLPPFPVDALPMGLAQWVTEEAEATQTPADMAALLSLAVCSATLAKRIVIQGFDGWIEPPNLYVAVILEPGNRKSEVFKHAIKPLRELQAKLRADSAEKLAIETSERRQADRRLAKLEKTAAEHGDATKREDARQEAAELAKTLAAWPVPAEPTLIADDVTSQKLEVLLESNDERLAIMAPEGEVFEMMAGKYSKDGATDMGIYLRAHPGESVTVHRMGRPTVELDSPLITLALTIQPAVIHGLASKPTFLGRGLLGRFLYAAPESPVGRRKVATPPVTKVASLAYSKLVTTLASFAPDASGQPQLLTLSVDAKLEFQQYCESLEQQLGFGKLQSMKEWGGKLAGATLRIAGVLHCIKHSNSACVFIDIDLETIKEAQRIANWAIPHASTALDLLSACDDRVRDDALFLLSWLRFDRASDDTFTRSEARRHGHRKFTRQAERLEAALLLLEETYHIANLNLPKTGGNVTYAISPYLKCDSHNFGANGANERSSNPLESPQAPSAAGRKTPATENVPVMT
ncbi:YfjI family protein [Rosistilla oblonga]|uniref:YfjI family protein n=1 Tax=Rosistilla oblonga TaxID=2527990 RepID=UPI003A96B273